MFSGAGDEIRNRECQLGSANTETTAATVEDTATPTLTETSAAVSTDTPTATLTATATLTETVSGTATSTSTLTATATATMTETVAGTPTLTVQAEAPPAPFESAYYIYDGDDNMVMSVINGVTTYYPDDNYVVEDNSSTITVTKTYFANTTAIAVRTIVDLENTLYWLLTDHLGSSSITTTTDGTWNSEIRYTPYGETRYSSGITPTDFRYTGQLQQADINLYFYDARWYDPALGRFIQPDSIIPDANDHKSYDRFTYVNNNPILYNDPSGHFINLGFAAVGAIIGAATGALMSAGPQMVQNIQNGQPLTANIDASKVVKDAAIGAAVGAVGGLTFGLGLAAGTAISGVIGISGSSGIAASIAGGVTVGLSSAAAGQTSRATENLLTGKPIGQGLGNIKDMAIDATIGMVTFKLSGANFKQIVPADYTSLEPFAKQTTPSKNPTSTTKFERTFVQGEQCHTCGRWAPKMYADHVGPRGPVIAPQCPNCSCTQGGYVRQGTNTTLPNHIWSGRWWNGSWAPYWKIWDRKEKVK